LAKKKCKFIVVMHLAVQALSLATIEDKSPWDTYLI